MRRAVSDVYRNRIGLPTEWTLEQQELFIGLVGQRLDYKAFDLAVDLNDQAKSRWIRENNQQPPDFQTAERLYETALENAREATVRQELYDLIAPTADDETPPSQPPPVRPIAFQDRWRYRWYRSEPSESLEELAQLVWPDHSAMFQLKASLLLTSRMEEGRPLPDSPQHRLATDLMPQINAGLADYGYPPE